MGNTGMSRGTGNKGKKSKSSTDLIPHKEATIRSSPLGTSYIILLCIAKKPPDQRNQVKENYTKVPKQKQIYKQSKRPRYCMKQKQQV